MGGWDTGSGGGRTAYSLSVVAIGLTVAHRQCCKSVDLGLQGKFNAHSPALNLNRTVWCPPATCQLEPECCSRQPLVIKLLVAELVMYVYMRAVSVSLICLKWTLSNIITGCHCIVTGLLPVLDWNLKLV